MTGKKLVGKAGYPADFWSMARHAHQLNAVSDARLARDLGVDRKHLRERRDKEAWERIGERPAASETIGVYFLLIETALCFKNGEFADWDALVAGAEPQSVADFIRPRAEKHEDWPNVRG